MASKIAALLLLGVCVIVCVSAGEHGDGKGFTNHIDWWNDLDAAKAEMKATGKPGAVLIHKSWCGACKRLKADFGDKADSDVVRASKDYVMVSLSDDDEPKLPGFAPDGGYIPRLIFLDSDGEVRTDLYNVGGNAKYKYFYTTAQQIAVALAGNHNKLTQGKDDL